MIVHPEAHVNTQRAAELGWQVCPNCHGEGREWHGKVDSTCMTCKNTGLLICPECRQRNVRQGHERCHTCEHGRAA